MPHRVVIPDSGNAVLYDQPYHSMWGWLYPGTDFTSTVQGLSTPTPPQANALDSSRLGLLGTPRYVCLL